MGYSCIRRLLLQGLKRITIVMKVLVEVVGWVGALMMLSAYVLLTLGRLKSQSPWYHWLNIVSGAGHDAAYVSRVAPTAMIFVPCRDGVSHNEAEHTSKEQCAAGAQVLLQAVLDYDRTLAERSR